MYQKLMHNKSLRLIGGLLGGLLLSVAINVFIVPQGLYGGGAYGLCQVIRTLLQRELSLSLPFDLAGVLYFFVNIPLFLLAYKALGREFFWKAAICTVCNSVFLAVIPSPSTPVIPDILTSCMVGGILAGFASGLVLTCGCSTGGLDILGLYLSKKGSRFTVGRFSISFNALLYTLCFFLFDATTAIYSAIYNVLSSLFLDRIHRQNVTVQLLIFTKKNDPQLPRYIMEQLDRGVTSWTGRGRAGPATRCRCSASACPSMRSTPCRMFCTRWTRRPSTSCRRASMPAAISSATWGDSNRKNHKTPSSGMVFFLAFSGNCGCESGNVSNLSADKKRNRRKPFLQAGQRLVKRKKTASVGNVFTLPHFFAQINQKFIQT